LTNYDELQVKNQMTQIGEAVKAGQIQTSITKCPFQDPEPPEDTNPEDEDYAWDDSLSMTTAQANSGSKLGTNCENGSPGAEGTWNVLGGDPDRYQEPQVDTSRSPSQPKVKVGNLDYPYTVAAHHLIPGNAALYKSQLFKSYMKKGGKMEVDSPKKMTFTVSRNIGYNVNGSHNGVWLPGSYAIRAGVHPSKLTWSALIDNPAHTDWCYEYIAAVAKLTRAQFHDAHTNYNENALKVLEKLTVKLIKHQVLCEECKSKTSVPPPYMIKAKLYRLSKYFRSQCQLHPKSWKAPWMASDQVNTDILSDSTKKRAFMDTYKQV
jgi:hypothetical protein